MKLLALAPFAGLAGCIYDTPPSGFDLNVFLHGFFFMEFQNGRLIVASPATEVHKFGYWDHNDYSLHDIPPSGSFSWITELQPGRTKKFPKEVLRFANSDIRASGPFIPSQSEKHKIYMDLPLPGNIAAIREGGFLDDLRMDENGKVCQSMYKRCGRGRRVSLISCLQYKTSQGLGFKNISIYAEHCREPHKDDLNYVFGVAKDAFAPEFDITLIAEPPERMLPKPKYDDEKALCELPKLGNNPCTQQCDYKLIRTANCPQFGVVQS